MQTFSIPNTLARVVKIYDRFAPEVPKELFSVKSGKPDLEDIDFPLPSKKRDYTCFAKSVKALWLGAANGLTRYEAKPEFETDRVMYFSASRFLADDNVKSVYCDSSAPESVWVLTDKGVSHITLEIISAEEKAQRLHEESEKYVSRRGMITQRHLSVARELDTVVPYGHSDNSGTFTAGYAIGELCKYAVYKRELGEEHPKTVAAKKSAIRATEACLLLMYIHGRGDGFIARTYIVSTEPLPNDGLFFRKQNGKAVCLNTSGAKSRKMNGMVIDASHPVPERLARLYTDLGYTDNDITYKGDTSSDEITSHYMLMYFFHEILGDEDKELHDLMTSAAKATVAHILDNGNEFIECNGKPTTWAKWSENYFNSFLGWSDGCLNSAELLMYLKVVMHITGETGRWLEAYNDLIENHGYAKLSTMHEARFHISAMMEGGEPVEGLMYGDHFLATAAYFVLIQLEKDETLREMYKAGYKGWNGTFRREHNPIYDFPYMLSLPEEKLDTSRHIDWFRRNSITRLITSCGISKRLDAPVRYRFGGEKETTWLIEPDELPITKYDRNPYNYNDIECEDCRVVESAYVYTFAYWLGRYYGIIQED